MSYYAGLASAGTLGYIHGNTRGAYKAVKAYRSFHKDMAPLTRRKTLARQISREKWKKLASKLVKRNLVKKAGKVFRKTPRKRLAYKVPPVAGHSTAASIYAKVFRSKGKVQFKRHRLSGVWRHFQTHQNLVTGTAGNQTSFDMLFVNSIPQNYVSTGPGYAIYQAYNAYKQLNPNLATTGSGLMSPTTLPADDRYVLLGHNIDVEISNFSAVAIEFDLYVYKCIKPSTFSVYTLWGQGYSNMSFGQGQIVPPVPGSTAGTAGYNALNIVGSRPTESRVLKNFWKLQKVKHFMLEGNGTQKVNFHIVQNQLIRNEQTAQLSAQGNVYMPGSYDILCVARGQVVEDVTVALAPLSTFGSIKFGWIATVKTSLTGVPNMANRLNSNNAAVNYSTAATTANQKIINEVDNPSTVAAVTA